MWDLPGPGINPCPLHWQEDSYPFYHQGSPINLHLPKPFVNPEFLEILITVVVLALWLCRTVAQIWKECVSQKQCLLQSGEPLAAHMNEWMNEWMTQRVSRSPNPAQGQHGISQCLVLLANTMHAGRVHAYACVCAQSCPILCNHMYCSLYIWLLCP